jgi:hypothetical protein
LASRPEKRKTRVVNTLLGVGRKKEDRNFKE